MISTAALRDADEVLDTSYEPFSREPEYRDANRAFVETLGIGREMRILDLACGTGTMSDIILAAIAALDRGAKGGLGGPRIVCVDLSRQSLEIARTELPAAAFRHLADDSAAKDGPHIVLVQGNAEAIPVADDSCDLVVMGNAIQLVPHLDLLLSEVRRTLSRGGRFAFNTSFYAGTYCAGTEHVYLRWVQTASTYIARQDDALKAAGLPGVSRRRGVAGRAFSHRWLSSIEYAERMERQGFRVQFVNERVVLLNQRCFETIGAYAGLAKVLLSGYPEKLACEALQYAAGPTLESVGLNSVPRFWLEMVGVRAG